jgi:hypothetical protein
MIYLRLEVKVQKFVVLAVAHWVKAAVAGVGPVQHLGPRLGLFNQRR